MSAVCDCVSAEVGWDLLVRPVLPTFSLVQSRKRQRSHVGRIDTDRDTEVHIIPESGGLSTQEDAIPDSRLSLLTLTKCPSLPAALPGNEVFCRPDQCLPRSLVCLRQPVW
ncbi:unnamed protein product [Protopolystoma xenopodis]|uniref:Uncharacterized protein n=1 Tax=Protopolystoma xenopodis TaxID=117903 RepID=A0A3S5C6A0_9PLAT|nr:unnamed protein product [Protopolystoma xenopodis]